MKGPETKKIEKLFDSIADDYDRLNHILSLGTDKRWRRRALKQIVDKKYPQDILDVACGTGDFSIAIADAAHPESKITAIDISEGMLAVMREKLAGKDFEKRISILEANGENLPFPSLSFDRVTIAFGIRNFEHREVALKEILRVLRPGGKLVILELSTPSSPFLRWIYSLYFTRALPLIGGHYSHKRAAYRYLPASVLNFPKRKEWIAIMEGCGFRDVTHKALTFGICRMYTGTK